MAWSGIARQEHSREGLRYPSDMIDGEWALVVSSSWPPRRAVDMREVLNARLYLASAGGSLPLQICQWFG